jgi:hypothetical protein
MKIFEDLREENRGGTESSQEGRQGCQGVKNIMSMR